MKAWIVFGILLCTALTRAQTYVHLTEYQDSSCTQAQGFDHSYTVGSCEQLAPNPWYTLVTMGPGAGQAQVTWSCYNPQCQNCGYVDTVTLGKCSPLQNKQYMLVVITPNSASSSSSSSIPFPPTSPPSTPSAATYPGDWLGFLWAIAFLIVVGISIGPWF